MARDKKKWEKQEITPTEVGNVSSLGLTESDEQAAEPAVQDAPVPKAKPAREPEVGLHDAVHALVDDSRWKAHWDAPLKKHAQSMGIGETATLARWKDCLDSFGVKTK